ncbi:MAG: glucokinase [Pseudomonadota bacterium]|jgi:glucokinase
MSTVISPRADVHAQAGMPPAGAAGEAAAAGIALPAQAGNNVSVPPTAGAARAAAPQSGLPWLVADIGGTNARFGWVTSDHPGARAQQVRKLPVAAYADPAAAARAYLDSLAQELGSHYQAPRRAAMAVATALAGDQISFTNSHWSFSRAALQATLGLDELLALNDFEALALALPTLGEGELICPGRLPDVSGTLAVIGPGTGLGVAGVVRAPGNAGWIALPGEGGHATLSAADDFEAELLRQVRGEYPHVSAERLLSGIGLPVLQRGVDAVLGLPARQLGAEQIVELGLAGADAACSRSIDVFCAMLGSFAGNVALTLGARGGVFIGGGIVPRLGERFFRSGFQERFVAKGRFRAYLEAIPTALITDTLCALTGSAQALRQSPR